MGNSTSLYDIRIDGESITDLPKNITEPLQLLMEGHQTLIVMRRPDPTTRSGQIDGSDPVYSNLLTRLEDTIETQRTQVSSIIESTIKTINEQFNDVRALMNDAYNKHPTDSTALKTTIDLLSGRVNDIANMLPLTLQSRFDTQTDRLIGAITDTLKPKDSINATVKGAAYEQEVVQGFESLKIPTLSIERVSSEHECCDIHVIDTTMDILYAVECKNYTTNVGSSQLAKFKRDLSVLRDSPDYSDKTIIGMFLSKQTKIVGHGAIDIDEDGNVYLACEYNNPLMWHAIITYCGKLKKRNRDLANANTDSDEHMHVLLSAYNALKDAESMGSLIANNIVRLNDSIKDLKAMAERIKPLSEIIERFDKLYHLDVKPEKAKRGKKNKKDVLSEPIAMDIDLPSEDDTMDVKPKRKYTKRTAIKKEESMIPLHAKNSGSSIGWSDDE